MPWGVLSSYKERKKKNQWRRGVLCLWVLTYRQAGTIPAWPGLVQMTEHGHVRRIKESDWLTFPYLDIPISLWVTRPSRTMMDDATKTSTNAVIIMPEYPMNIYGKNTQKSQVKSMGWMLLQFPRFLRLWRYLTLHILCASIRHLTFVVPVKSALEV